MSSNVSEFVTKVIFVGREGMNKEIPSTNKILKKK